MKRLLSICFTCILLFNLFGYRLLINYLQDQQQMAVAQRIDLGIDDSELISLRVPAGLPYYTNSNDFQWIDGEVEIEGTVYKYVKRRIYNDSIEYLCLRDHGKTNLLNARDHFFQLAYDLQTTKQKSNAPVVQIKPLMLEYCDWHKAFRLDALPLPEQHHQYLLTTSLKEAFKNLPIQPPEIIC